MKLLSTALFVLILLAVTACMQEEIPKNTKVENSPIHKRTRCTDPRPQICTREYRPVCATLKGGIKKTYATGCTACADSKVYDYTPGACAHSAH